MADQELGIKVKTTSDVPEAMGKAKAATVSFAQQVQDIQRKFSTAFKDIFLGFTAPMIIVNTAMQMIQQRLEDAKKLAAEGASLIAKGETKYATSDEKKLANFMKMKEEDEKERAQVYAGMQKITEDYLTKTEEGKKIAKEIQDKGGVEAELLYRRTYTDEMKKKALDAFLNSEEGKKFKPVFDAAKQNAESTFKAPEGFGNVVGVGPNPVMEAMNAQTEELKKQTELLTVIAASSPAAIPPDFTKTKTA